MGTWVALLGAEQSDEQLATKRKPVAEQFKIEKFTCDTCGARRTCCYAFDPYNTDDDCLAEK